MTDPVYKTIADYDALPGSISGNELVESEVENTATYKLTLTRIRDWILNGIFGLPSGGTTGQYLRKSSSTNGQATWENFPSNVSAFTNDANYLTAIPNASVTATKIASNAVTSDKIQDGAIGTSKIADGAVTIPKLSATGTANNTTYLRGDGTWSTVSSGGSAITVQDEGTTLTSNATSFNFTGAGVTATNSGGAVTVNVSAGGGSSLTTSVITTNTTAVSNTRYLCNTSSGSFTLTLPASPNNGDVIEVADFNNSSLLTGFGVNPLTITANTGHNIVGNTNLVLDRGGQGVELVFHTNRWSIVSGIGETQQINLLADIQAMLLAGGI
jgi:hypothetical protein